MKYFSSSDGSIYHTKINFVDEHNALVGYDFSANCCEDFGWYISDRISIRTEESMFTDVMGSDAINQCLDGWTFDTEFFRTLEEGDRNYMEENTVIFRLVNGSNELFLHLYNVHNGYYSHGFVFSKNGVSIETGFL